MSRKAADPEAGRRALTRRRLLGGLGAGALAAAVGGCASGGESTPNDLADSPTTFGHHFPQFTGDAQLNPWGGSYPWSVAGIFFAVPSVAVPGEGRRLLELVEAVEVDGTTATVSYDDGFTWWNGEPVTARDPWVAARIRSYLRRASRGEEAGRTVTATLVDERAVSYEFDRPLAREMVLDRVASSPVNAPAWLFDPWRERFADATTRDARSAVAERLRGRTISLEEAAEEGIGSGPYELTEVAPNRLVCERFPGHPRADDLAVERLWFPVARELTVDGLIENGWLDGERGVLEESQVSPPEYVEQLARYPTTDGTKFSLNWRNDHLARRAVRRAIACVVPLDAVATTGGWGRPTRVQTGLAAPAARRWLDGDLRAQLHRYPVEGAPERAGEHLRRAEYSRRDGTWRDPDGTPVSVRILSPLFEGWPGATGIVADALESFGFDVEYRQLSNAAFLSAVRRGDYDVAPWWTDGRPFAAFDPTSTEPATLGYGLDGAGERPELYKPVSPLVPRTPGRLRPAESQLRRLDLREQWARISGRTSTAATAEAVARVAAWWNYDLPDLGVATAVTGVWGNTRDFAWPEPDDWRYRAMGPSNRPEYHLLRTGAVRTNRRSNADRSTRQSNADRSS